MGKASFNRLLWVTVFLLALPIFAACGFREATAEPTPTPTLPPPYVITLGEPGISSSTCPLVCAPDEGATLPQEFDACWLSWGNNRVAVALEGNSLHLAVAPTTKEAGRFIPDTDRIQQVTFRLEEKDGVVLGYAEGEQNPRFIATTSGVWMKGEGGWEPIRLPSGMLVAVASVTPEGISAPQPIDPEDQATSFLIQALTNPKRSSLSLSPGAPLEAVASWTAEGTRVDEKALAKFYQNYLLLSDGKRVFVLPGNYFSAYGINPQETDPGILSAILQESGIFTVIRRLEAASMYVAISEDEGWVFGVTEEGEAFSYQIVRNKNGQWRLKELALPSGVNPGARIGFDPSTGEVVCLDQNGKITHFYNPEREGGWETVAERDFYKALNELAGPLQIDPEKITDNYNDLLENKEYQALMLRDARGEPAVFVLVREKYGVGERIAEYLAQAAEKLNQWDPEFLAGMREDGVVVIAYSETIFGDYPDYGSTINLLGPGLYPDQNNWKNRNGSNVYGVILINKNNSFTAEYFNEGKFYIEAVFTILHEYYNIQGFKNGLFDVLDVLENTYQLSMAWLEAHGPDYNMTPQEYRLLKKWIDFSRK